MMKLAMMTQAYTVQRETKRDFGNIDCNPMDTWQKKEAQLAASRWQLCVIATSLLYADNNVMYNKMFTDVEAYLQTLASEEVRFNDEGRVRALGRRVVFVDLLQKYRTCLVTDSHKYDG